MIFKNLCVLVLRTNISSALEGLMLILGAFAPEACDFATRCLIIGVVSANGHINYQLGHFENVCFVCCLFSKFISEHIFFKDFCEHAPRLPHTRIYLLLNLKS